MDNFERRRSSPRYERLYDPLFEASIGMPAELVLCPGAAGADCYFLHLKEFTIEMATIVCAARVPSNNGKLTGQKPTSCSGCFYGKRMASAC
ncbi:hypothetical protein [Paraburkholderia elongata]|uniref:Uncharacterized protein n=1 Tax=Paraburkholderia elongata TaxID=2675747 RepID=A0A972SPG2_9BURK|nr:hypothetical protein [Paraburkholderia elongata]NPT62339.1 hypothetical protein [Paraburkholderia elongata]